MKLSREGLPILFCKYILDLSIKNMEQQCRFCSQHLRSIQEVLDHYNENHEINKENSLTIESYLDAIARDSPQMFVEFCE